MFWLNIRIWYINSPSKIRFNFQTNISSMVVNNYPLNVYFIMKFKSDKVKKVCSYLKHTNKVQFKITLEV